MGTSGLFRRPLISIMSNFQFLNADSRPSIRDVRMLKTFVLFNCYVLYRFNKMKYTTTETHKCQANGDE